MNSHGRCRVRDLVSSCFNTCRLPLEEEEAGISGSREPTKKSKKAERRLEEKNAAKAVERRCSSHSFDEEDYIVFCFGEDGEIQMINGTKSSHICSSRKGEEEEMRGVEQSKMESSFESCDSNLSDTSTSSFAFPILGKEWIGSPAHMPKPKPKPNTEKGINCCIHTN